MERSNLDKYSYNRSTGAWMSPDGKTEYDEDIEAYATYLEELTTKITNHANELLREAKRAYVDVMDEESAKRLYDKIVELENNL